MCVCVKIGEIQVRSVVQLIVLINVKFLVLIIFYDHIRCYWEKLGEGHRGISAIFLQLLVSL